MNDAGMKSRAKKAIDSVVKDVNVLLRELTDRNAVLQNAQDKLAAERRASQQFPDANTLMLKGLTGDIESLEKRLNNEAAIQGKLTEEKARKAEQHLRLLNTNPYLWHTIALCTVRYMGFSTLNVFEAACAACDHSAKLYLQELERMTKEEFKQGTFLFFFAGKQIDAKGAAQMLTDLQPTWTFNYTLEAPSALSPFTGQIIDWGPVNGFVRHTALQESGTAAKFEADYLLDQSMRYNDDLAAEWLKARGVAGIAEFNSLVTALPANPFAGSLSAAPMQMHPRAAARFVVQSILDFLADAGVSESQRRNFVAIVASNRCTIELYVAYVHPTYAAILKKVEATAREPAVKTKLPQSLGWDEWRRA